MISLKFEIKLSKFKTTRSNVTSLVKLKQTQPSYNNKTVCTSK